MKVFTAVGDTSLFGLGGVALLGWPVQFWLAALAIAYALIRIVFVSAEFYWKWKDRHDSQNRQHGDDGGTA